MKRTILWLIFLCGIGLSAQTPDHQIEFRGEGTGKDYTEARNAAMNDVAVQIGRYIFAFIKSDLNEQLTYQSENSKTISDSEFTSSETRVFSEMLVSNIAIDKEFPMPRQADGKYRIILSCLMSESGLEAQKNRYISGVSQRYAAQILAVKTRSGSVYELVSGYEAIRSSLADNPVAQSVAVFFNEDTKKQEHCYDYSVSEIRRIGNGVALKPFPPAFTMEKSGPQEISLELNSSAIYKMGRIECVTRYNGLPPVIVQPDDNNRVAVRVDAASLPVGRCRGSVAVKLSALSPLLRDITGEFAFEVTLPAPPEKPFSPDALGGVWSGVLSYSAGGQSYRDSYTLNVYADGTCWITVTARDGEAQAAGGLWSESDGVLRIENCVFEAPAIARLPSLRWIGRYTLGNNNRRLSVNIKPAPDYSGVVGLVLNKER